MNETKLGREPAGGEGQHANKLHFAIYFATMLKFVLFVAAACDVNCARCDTSGQGKCDDNHCNDGYDYISESQTCAGTSLYCMI